MSCSSLVYIRRIKMTKAKQQVLVVVACLLILGSGVGFIVLTQHHSSSPGLTKRQQITQTACERSPNWKGYPCN